MNQTAESTQMEQLLALLERHRQDTCERVLAESRREAADLARQARRAARQRVAAAVAGERRRLAETVRDAEAHIATRKRQRRQAQAAHWLERGWALLEQALAARWADPAARRVWCRSLFLQGQGALGSGGWVVEYPQGSDVEAIRHCMQEVIGGQSARLVADPELRAGLRIHADDACLDGSIAGLTADHAQVQALLLAQMIADPEEAQP